MYGQIFLIKKRVWVTRLFKFIFNVRGYRIPVCDIVLPKHTVRNLRQYSQETSHAITCESVLQDLVDSQYSFYIEQCLA